MPGLFSPPPLRMPAAGGRLQFPACSGNEERSAASRDYLLWLPCVRTSCLVVQCDLLVLCSRASLLRFRHAKNQISYDPTGKSWRLKPRPPSSPFGVEPRWSVPGPLREETGFIGGGMCLGYGESPCTLWKIHQSRPDRALLQCVAAFQKPAFR